jgi:hypothetical protein
MEWQLDNIFNEDWLQEQIGDEGTGGLWDRIRQSAFLESDTPHGPSHTGRQFTNDQVFHNGFKHHQLQQGSQFTLGILHYLKMRRDSAQSQLAKIRKERGIKAGSSGVSFPTDATPIPAVDP